MPSVRTNQHSVILPSVLHCYCWWAVCSINTRNIYNCRKDEELITLLRSYDKQVSINAMKKNGAPLLGLAKYIYYVELFWDEIGYNRTDRTPYIIYRACPVSVWLTKNGEAGKGGGAMLRAKSKTVPVIVTLTQMDWGILLRTLGKLEQNSLFYIITHWMYNLS